MVWAGSAPAPSMSRWRRRWTITTAATLPATSVGLVYPGVGLTVIGGTAPYFWSVTSGQLPPGLALNSTHGAIAGAAVQSGTYTFTAQARDSSDPRRVATKVFTINVGPPFILTGRCRPHSSARRTTRRSSSPAPPVR